MNQIQQTKKFFIEYWNALSGQPKPEELIRKYVADERLVQHILFFESIFPEYRMIPHEVIAEEDRLFVRASLQAKHSGELDDLPATQKQVDAPFALGYKIRNGKIVHFWAIADQMELLQQLGLSAEQVEVHPVL